MVAAASLYFYAQGTNLNVKLWTSLGGTVQGQQIVLETLAGVNPSSDKSSRANSELPDMPLIWLTHRQDSLSSLSSSSRWLLWADQVQDLTESSGILIKSDDQEAGENPKNEFTSLRSQLQKQIKFLT